MAITILPWDRCRGERREAPVIRLEAIANRPRFWETLIGVSAAAALLLNLAGLLAGITVAIPHLLYIPVVITAYRFPRRGAIAAAALGAIYFLMVFILAGSMPEKIYEAIVRIIVLVIIGWLVGWLTYRLREQEALYQGLFEHSESGTILISDTGAGRTIEAVNWKAADLLHRKAGDLTGSPLSLIWGGDDEPDFFSRLAREGAVYAADTVFRLPDNRTFIVLVSAAPLPGGRAVLTFTDITGRVRAEQALRTANDKLSMLSRISADHLHFSVDRILETVEEADARCADTGTHGYLDRIRTFAWNISRQLLLTESYKDLGTTPPVWMSVRQVFESGRLMQKIGTVSLRIWTERLEIYADPLFADVLVHLVENSLRHGRTVKNIVVTYRETPEGLDLSIRDDGQGIPAEKKDRIFEYDSGGQAGIGLFICRQIAGVTGMTLREIGIPGSGAWFVIHVPAGRYRIEGTSDDAPPSALPRQSPGNIIRHSTGATVRELLSSEFPLADALWVDYHTTTGDPRTDRIFAAFHDGQMVSLARCRRHPDGYEVDGVFTPPGHRGHGFAHAAVWGLVEACGSDVLYMHSVRGLEKFYGAYGFVPINEKELPQSIRERFAWAQGEMEGANVDPMMRVPPS
ncbi:MULTISPECIES: GNAT family N-acetyltransferase [unclassified Methanoregula]|uniref:GNAT family N-acetyltransferase n=1 Tax=unclassified Methanoregula TaxID=2649730 RepID=UPI0009CD48B4|nr:MULTISPECIES: GNAT family N-acetyltransferase [unclassified Methanoregula]OPX65322.1 MAG: sensor protein KdpD [Methanoregula sp. PtaB.Bin085]OPY32231.1 MAG: sensor protein KdpD [Methanoregula sp. PtaU1.Bin006]